MQQFGSAVHVAHHHLLARILGIVVTGSDVLTAALGPDGIFVVTANVLTISCVDDAYQLGIAVTVVVVQVEIHIAIHSGDSVLTELVEVGIG